MNEEYLRRTSDPKYDEDLVNKRYLEKIIDSIIPIGIQVISIKSPSYGKWKLIDTNTWKRVG